MDSQPAPCNQARMSAWRKSDGLAAMAFIALVCITRWPVLHRSVLDWDESLYFLMADAWRHGALPYSNIWDNKPLGIYAIFAVFQTLIPGTEAIRAATMACVSVLAFTVYRITFALTGQRVAGLAAGAVLIAASLSNDGLAGNTELFMAAFTAAAVLAALTGRSGFLVGLLLGCAIMVKYVALFEAPVVAFWFLSRQRRVAALLPLALGGLLPLATVVLLYAAAGKLGLWWDCSAASNFRRVDVPFTRGALDYAFGIEWARWGRLYLSALALTGWAFWRRERDWLFLAAWFAAGFLGVAAAKSFFDHYFLQILPVLCVMLGVLVSQIPPRLGQLVLVMAALIGPIQAAQIAFHDATGPDSTAALGAALKGASSLYVFDGQPILYALAGAAPPTRYVLPSVLTGTALARVAGVDATAEVARIMAGAPEFVVARVPPPLDNPRANQAVYAEMAAFLAKDYVLWHQLPGVAIYQRITP